MNLSDSYDSIDNTSSTGLPEAAQDQQNTTKTSRRARWARRVAAVIAATSLAGSAALAGQGAAFASSTPTNPQSIGMFDSPAVQLVTNQQHATVTWFQAQANINALVHFANTDSDTIAAWRQRNYDAASADIVRHFLTRPAGYLSRGAATPVPLSGTEIGSAWGVSSNGYLVTNHHVVQFTDNDTWIAEATAPDSRRHQPAVAVEIAQSLASQLVKINWSGRRLTFTRDEYTYLVRLAQRWVDATSQVSDRSQVIDVGGGQNLKVDDPGMQARVVNTSKGMWPRADVAILKVDATDLPVVPLGDDTTLQAGDSVYALGYPYAASFQAGTIGTSVVTATMSAGQVTNRLRSPGGFSSIEDSAPINHGSSGGPLVDAEGKVVGMVTAVDPSTDSSSEINGGKFFYAMPVSVVKKYLTASGITPLVAPDQSTYDEAMTLMQQSHYKAAMSDLKQVETNGYDTPYVMMHAQMVQRAIHEGKDKPLHNDRRLLILAAGSTGAAVVVMGGVALLLVRRSRRSSLTPQPAPQWV